jgi:hypothetical protein
VTDADFDVERAALARAQALERGLGRPADCAASRTGRGLTTLAPHAGDSGRGDGKSHA